MIDKPTAIILGSIVIGIVIYLSFVNWHAAVIILLIMILANLGGKKT